MASELELLRRLAEAHGVLTEYEEQAGRARRPGPDSLRAVLAALGVAASRPSEVTDGLARHARGRWRRPLPAVVVAWDGRAELDLRLPAKYEAALELELRLETGELEAFTVRSTDCTILERAEADGRRWVRRACPLPFRAPTGYHRLHLSSQGVEQAESLLLSAPLRAYEHEGRGAWGVFLPTYALHSKDSWGAGNLSDLEALLEWVDERGGEVVSTLPLLPAFLDRPFDPSPYAPVSRLFWNELYLDPTRLPELEDSGAARNLLGSLELRDSLADLRAAPLVYYREQMAMARRVLDLLARSFFTEPRPERLADFERYREAHPHLEDYARFRAVVDSRGEGWTAWPGRLRDGEIRAGDYLEGDLQYHLFAQWNTERQLARLAGCPPLGETGEQHRRSGLCLDLPLGVQPAGYDTWRERESFVPAVSTGAPPDAFFTRGQNWGFHPPHPERCRQHGYSYLRAALGNQLQYASYTRIDHVMSLHRLFWIPEGAQSGEGTYVRYPHEELYAVYTIESHRHGTALVGEDLGTVPPEVRPAMHRHGLRRMYVLQYELQPQVDGGLNPVPPDSVASLNTHDMPTWAAFLSGCDIDERAKAGHLSPEEVPAERQSRRGQAAQVQAGLETAGFLVGRENEPRALLRAALGYLASSPAELVLVNLEDAWLETKAQNIPGTSGEYPNWRRRARYSLEELGSHSEVRDILTEVRHARKRVSSNNDGKEPRAANIAGAGGR